VLVDPIKPTLKAPGTQRLKLKHNQPLSKIAFKFNLRRYDEVFAVDWSPMGTKAASGGKDKMLRLWRH
jgi:WD40 repeat protein